MRTNDEIRSGIASAKALSAKCLETIRALQEECAHTGVAKIPKANTGNYDPSEDCYWYECKCPVCDKFWTEDQ
jgi:hypothetical protein